MPRKKQGLSDVEANFFGDDDLDWLSEDAEEGPSESSEEPAVAAAEEAPAPAEPNVPAAPPPTPPAQLGSNPPPLPAAPPPLPDVEEAVEASAPEASEPEGSDAEASDAEASSAEGSDAEASSAEGSDVEASEAEASSAEGSDVEASDAEASDAEASEEAGMPRLDDTSDVLMTYYGDELDEQEDVPMVSGPRAAGLEAADLDSSGLPGVEVASVTVDTPALSWAPQDAQDAIREAVAALVAESAEYGAPVRGAMRVAAARMHYEYLGDLASAEALLHQAEADGVDTPSLHQTLADVSVRNGDWKQAIQHMIARGRGDEAIPGAEHLVDAALVARQHLGDVGQAVVLLTEAVKKDPDNYVALCRLRDVYRVPEEDAERAKVIERIARKADHTVAADAWYSYGQLLETVDRPRDAQDAYLSARGADPAHTPAFLALERLYRGAADDVSRAALYEEEARRTGQTDAGWWHLKAARHFAAAEQRGRADAAFRAAVEAGAPRAFREQQAWFRRTARYELVVGALESEVEGLTGAQRAYQLYRLAVVRENHTKDLAGALSAYLEVVSLDPEAGPAREAASRLLRAEGRPDEAAALWRDHASHVDTERARLDLHRVGEACGADGDHTGARAAYADILKSHPADTAARDGLVRALRGADEHAELASTLEGWAAESDGPAAAGYLIRAARVVERSLGDGARAAELAAKALAVEGGAPTALQWVALDTAEAGEAWSTLVPLLDGAAAGTEEPEQQVRFLYRAATVSSAKLDDADAGLVFARRCVELAPAFSPAVGLAKELALRTGKLSDAHETARAEARVNSEGERAWSLLAAAELAQRVDGADPLEDLLRVLAKDQGHAGAFAALEVSCLRHDDHPALVEVYGLALPGLSDPDERATVCARMADLLRDLDDVEGAVRAFTELRNNHVAGRPLRAMARLAEGMGRYREAVELLKELGEAEDRLEHARVLAERLDRPRDALDIYRTLLEDEAVATRAAAGVARNAPRVGDTEVLARAHARLAATSSTDVVRASHHMWTASLLQAAGDDEGALGHLRSALQARPESRSAFLGVRALLVRSGNVDEIKALFAAHRPDGARRLAETLDRAGYDQADAWESAVEADDSLYVKIQLEGAYTRSESWESLCQVIDGLLGRLKNGGVKSRYLAKQRWLLAEKLSDTDQAWEIYKRLHEESPGDREITEAVARIAGARGESALAIQYLRELVEGAPSPADAARYQCRIGEVFEGLEDTAGARQAYLDALDHVSDDETSLTGLRRLAEGEQDWQGVVAVLQRESALVSGARRIEVLREIARVTEEHLGDEGVATDAWHAVLELGAEDREALEHIIELAQTQGEWALLVETGQTLAMQLSGEGRATLLARLGRTCEEHLDQDDAVRLYEQAIRETPPSAEAAKQLLDLYARRREWRGVVRCELVLAEQDDDERSLAHLEEAARVEADVRHDRQAAAGLYARILKLDPNHTAALRFQAQHLYNAGRLDEALPIFERLEPRVALEDDLDDFDVRMEVSSFYFRFAELLRLCARIDDAIERYERALELNPSHAPSLEAVGPLYVERQHWRKGERVFRQLLQLTGGQGASEKIADIYTQLGLVERALGNQEKAYKRFSKAIEVHPNHVGALKGMALIYEDRGHWNDLLSAYNNIIYYATIPSEVVDAYMTKGRILDGQMERPDKAAAHYERCLVVDANQPEALLRLAELAMRRGEAGEAGGLAQRGLQLATEPSELRASLLLAWAAAKHASGDTGGADAALIEAQACDPELVSVLERAEGADLDMAVVNQQLHARVVSSGAS